MRAMRSLIVSRSRASCDWKLATSRIVFSLSSSLKRASKRGRSSAFSRSSIARYSKAASTLASTSCVSQLEGVLVLGHRLDDLFAQPGELLVLGVDAVLQPFAHVLLAVVAGFH